MVNDAISEMAEYMDRLSNITRYPMWDRIKDINVAEHSFRVAMIALTIVEMSEGVKQKIDPHTLLLKALFHDFGEAMMGDITYRVKHRDEKTEKFFKRLEKSYIDEMFTETPAFKEYAKKCKEGLEGQIVGLADMFDNVLYGLRELRTGNVSMIVLVRRCVDYMLKITVDTEFYFLGLLAVNMLKESEEYMKLSTAGSKALEEKYGIRP